MMQLKSTKSRVGDCKSSLTIRDISASVSEWFIHELRYPTRVSRLLFSFVIRDILREMSSPITEMYFPPFRALRAEYVVLPPYHQILIILFVSLVRLLSVLFFDSALPLSGLSPSPSWAVAPVGTRPSRG